MSYDGKKNECKYDDQLKLYASLDNSTSALINIWREKNAAPVFEAKVLSETSFTDKLNHPLMPSDNPLN
jgi:hypothetical protein